MKILDRKNAMNRRQDEGLIIVETAIHRVCCLNEPRRVSQIRTQIEERNAYRFIY
jgi:hypothetical protein